jgi:hypothetical protein
MYFNGADGIARSRDQMLAQPDALAELQRQGQARFKQEFTWPHVLGQYEALLSRYLP